jgi:hypothetical protein
MKIEVIEVEIYEEYWDSDPIGEGVKKYLANINIENEYGYIHACFA